MPRRRAESASSTSPPSSPKSSSNRVCRFCLCTEEENANDEFVDPCVCRGSGKYVHLKCLVQHFEAQASWHNFKCPTCKHVYKGKALRELAQISFDRMVQAYGAGSMHVTRSMCYLAQADCQLGNATESKALLEQCLEIEERHHGPGHLASAATLVELACAHGKLGNVQCQKDLLEKSLAIREKHFGKGHISTAVTLNNLATAYSEMGDLERVRELLELSLAIKEQHFGKGHIGTTAAMVNLAGVYGELGENARGRELLMHCLAIEEQHLGAEHIETAVTLNNLALAYGETGDFEQMVSVLERCLAIKQRYWGGDHCESCLTLANLGMTYSIIGNVVSARSLCKRAMAASCGPNARRIGVVILRAAVSHCSMGETLEAETLTSRALQTLCDSLGVPVAQRVLTLERKRTSCIWSAAGRTDVLQWLQLKWDPNRLSSQSTEATQNMEYSSLKDIDGCHREEITEVQDLMENFMAGAIDEYLSRKRQAVSLSPKKKRSGTSSDWLKGCSRSNEIRQFAEDMEANRECTDYVGEIAESVNVCRAVSRYASGKPELLSSQEITVV